MKYMKYIKLRSIILTSTCLRCKEDFSNSGNGSDCSKCIDKVNQIIKKNLKEKQRELMIKSRFEILDL